MIFHNPQLQSDFERRGYVVVDGLLDAAALHHLRTVWRRQEGGVGQMAYSITAMSADGEYRRAVHAGVLAGLAAPLATIVRDYRILVGLFINKARGGAEGAVNLHQDWSMIDESAGARSLGVWAPLTEVHPLNGCLYVVPGSQHLHPWPRAQRGAWQPLDRDQILPILEEYLVPMVLQPGQALIFTHRLYHGSGPNLADSERPVAAASLIPHGAAPQVYRERIRDGQEQLEIQEAGIDFLLDYHEFSPLPEGPVLGHVPFVRPRLEERWIRETLRAAAG